MFTIVSVLHSLLVQHDLQLFLTTLKSTGENVRLLHCVPQVRLQFSNYYAALTDGILQGDQSSGFLNECKQV